MWFPLLCVLAIIGVFFLLLRDSRHEGKTIKEEFMDRITAASSADELMRVVYDVNNRFPDCYLSGKENDVLLQKALSFENELNEIHWAHIYWISKHGSELKRIAGEKASHDAILLTHL